MSAVLFGEPRQFAFGVTWLDCPPLGDLALTHTWCELTLLCRGVPLTRHTARGNVYEAVVTPAAPLAAWIGSSWEALIGQERLLDGGTVSSAHALFAKLTEQEWEENQDAFEEFLGGHALYRARGGLLLPNVIFWRRDDVIDISWRPGVEGVEPRRLHFIESGEARVSAAAFFDACRQFATAVSERARRAPEESFLRGEVENAKRRLSSLDDVPALAARVGREPHELEQWLRKRTRTMGIRDALRDAYGPEMDANVLPERLDSPLARAARSASPAFSADDHAKLMRLGEELRRLPPAVKLDELRRKALATAQRREAGTEDYERGYARAEAVREVLRNTHDRFEIEDILRENGCRVLEVAFDDVDTDGVALWTTAGHALVAANTSSPKTASPWGRRAMLAHELHHLLFDASSSAFFGECTSPWTATLGEREANAFAAELLVPARKLAGLPDPKDARGWREKVRELLASFGTGWELTVHHLANRRKISRPVEAALLEELNR